MSAQYFCGHCAEPRPLKWGYAPSDPRYAIVVCKSDDLGGSREYPGLLDQDQARALVAKVAAEKEAAKQEKIARLERRKAEIAEAKAKGLR